MELDNFEQVNCPVCGHNTFTKLYEVQYYNDEILPKVGVSLPYPKTYIVKCGDCQHHFSNPQLSDKALDLYYTKLNSEHYIDLDKTIDRLLPQHEQVVAELERRIPAGGRVLEIGCGYGYLLSLFDKKRWDCVGVEPFGEACEFASSTLGLSVIHDYLDYQTFPQPESFDVIMLFDVMEHLKKPLPMIELIKHYLKPGGYLVIGTGDITTLNARFSGNWWYYLTLREHVSFFSKRSMRVLLKEFKSVDIKTVSYQDSPTKNLMAFISNVCVRGLYNLIQHIQYPLTKFKLTRFRYVRYLLSNDHMLVIAKK